MSKVTKNDVGKRVTVEKKGEVGSPGSTVNRARTRTHRTLFPLCVFLFRKIALLFRHALTTSFATLVYRVC